MKTRTLIALFSACVLNLALLAAPSLAAGNSTLDFDSLRKDYGNPMVEINLSKQLIGLLGSLTKNENPELAELTANIENITVRVYQLDTNADKAIALVDKTTKALKKDKWEPIVSVSEPDSKVRIFSKTKNNIMDGLVVMVVGQEPKDGKPKCEAVFINIVGQIDPARIGELTAALDI